MENTAHLAMVQKTIIDTLYKEGKSQTVITERGDCSNKFNNFLGTNIINKSSL